MSTDASPTLVTVKASRGFATALVVLGVIFLAGGLALAFFGSPSFLLAVGPLFLLAGILSLVMPYYRYDRERGVLHVYSTLGYRMRSFGADESEQVCFDPAASKVVRVRPDGKQHKVSMFGVRRNDLARLVAALPAAPEAATANR
jgi:hypothetical protein